MAAISTQASPITGDRCSNERQSQATANSSNCSRTKHLCRCETARARHAKVVPKTLTAPQSISKRGSGNRIGALIV